MNDIQDCIVCTVQILCNTQCTAPALYRVVVVLVVYWCHTQHPHCTTWQWYQQCTGVVRGCTSTVLYCTGAVVTPVLHVGAVLDVLHQMRTPKLHVHHDQKTQKRELLFISNNQNNNDVLTYETGTDGGEKGTRGLRNDSVLLCKQSQITWLS